MFKLNEGGGKEKKRALQLGEEKKRLEGGKLEVEDRVEKIRGEAIKSR